MEYSDGCFTGDRSGIPVILIRPEKLHHALKELANKAQVVVETPEQAVKALEYVFAEE